jgi:nickel-dependent lactate racemase
LEHNPLHEEQLEIVRMLGDVLSLNVVQDEHRRLAYVTFGEIVESHLAAVSFVRDSTEIPVPRQFHTVVTSAAGYPLDKTYYQTVKGMVTPMDILAPGANLIVASECGDGLGSQEFRESQRRLVQDGAKPFLRQLMAKPLADVDEWQTEMQLKPMRVANIHLFSPGLSPHDHRLTGVNRIDSIEEAVRQSVTASGAPAVAVIPEGPYVVPYFAPMSLEKTHSLPS